MKGYYTGNQIIDEALAGVGDVDRTNYMNAAMYFMRGYRDFQLFDAFQEKEAWKTIDTNTNTIKIPDDCIRVWKVGVNVSGEFFTFTESHDMVLPSDPIDGQLFTDRNETDVISRSPQSGYGAKGVNLEYYFKVDELKRRIHLNRAAVDKTRFADRTEVLLKYISNNLDDLDKARVGMDAANMLIAFVEWKLVSSRPDKYDARYRMEKKVEYEETESRYRVLLIPDVGEMLDTIYETSGQNLRI